MSHEPALLVVHRDRVPYEQAWAEQRSVHAERVAGHRPDTVLLLEHPPVFTAGRRTNSWERPTDGAPVVDVDRGGRITWHGPGQLVGYPIVRLAQPLDVVAHVRRLEEAVMATCAALGLDTVRVPGRSGVWVDGGGAADRKVCAVGVRVAQGVTMHGLALNADCDLSWYDRIVPCGLPDAAATSLTAELGRRTTVAELRPLLEEQLRAVLVGQRVVPAR